MARSTPNLGWGIICPTPVNLVSLKSIKTRFDVTLSDDVFKIAERFGTRHYLAPATPSGLYIINPQPITPPSTHVKTQRELIEDLKQAKLWKDDETDVVLLAHATYLLSKTPRVRARILHATLGHPSEQWMCRMIAGGAFASWGLTRTDIRAAKLDSCLGCNRGKDGIMRKHEHTVPRSGKVGTEFHCDIAYVLDQRYLLAVEAESNYVVAFKLESKSEASLTAAMLQVEAHFVNLGWKEPKTFFWDGESGAIASIDNLRLKGITLRHVAAKQHEKIAEATTRIIHNHMRATYFSVLENFPIPIGAASYLFEYTIRALNNLSGPKTGSKSRRAVIHGGSDNGDYLGLPFGTVCMGQELDDHPKLLDLRNRLCFIIGHQDDSRNVRLWSLEKGQHTVLRSEIKVLEMTAELKAVVNLLADEQPLILSGDLVRLERSTPVSNFHDLDEDELQQVQEPERLESPKENPPQLKKPPARERRPPERYREQVFYCEEGNVDEFLAQLSVQATGQGEYHQCYIVEQEVTSKSRKRFFLSVSGEAVHSQTTTDQHRELLCQSPTPTKGTPLAVVAEFWCPKHCQHGKSKIIGMRLGQTQRTWE